MKRGGHPPNLLVGFKIGLLMCALAHQSHENSTPPAALHLDLVWAGGGAGTGSPQK